jgi:hypothetical protein
MTVSDQIITVLNDLCMKFGVAIDWSSENAIPYLQALCEKYINYEIATSIAYIVMACVGIAITIFIVKKIDFDEYGELCVLLILAAIILGVGSIATIIANTFDIIECLTIPEKTIFEYVKTLLRRP